MSEATSLNPAHFLELGGVRLGNTISLQQLHTIGLLCWLVQLGSIEIVLPVDDELEQLRRGWTVGVGVTKSEC